MGKKKKTRGKQSTVDVKSCPADDPKVAAALLKAWRSRYPPEDADVAEQEVELMRERGHCCYAALEEGVASRHFDGVSNFLVLPEYIDVATEALQQLQEYPCYATLAHERTDPKQKDVSRLKEKDAEPINETPQHTAVKVVKPAVDKPQTVVQKDGKLVRESAQPIACANADVNEDISSRGQMWNAAVKKAQQEMDEEFDYRSLCKQGQQLFTMVLHDKTKRLYGKLKQRARWKVKQKSYAKC